MNDRYKAQSRPRSKNRNYYRGRSPRKKDHTSSNSYLWNTGQEHIPPMKYYHGGGMEYSQNKYRGGGCTYVPENRSGGYGHVNTVSSNSNSNHDISTRIRNMYPSNQRMRNELPFQMDAFQMISVEDRLWMEFETRLTAKQSQFSDFDSATDWPEVFNELGISETKSEKLLRLIKNRVAETQVASNAPKKMEFLDRNVEKFLHVNRIPAVNQSELVLYTLRELEEMTLFDLEGIVGKGVGIKIFKLLNQRKKSMIAISRELDDADRRIIKMLWKKRKNITDIACKLNQSHKAIQQYINYLEKDGKKKIQLENIKRGEIEKKKKS